jgi:protein-disulfide isomerase
MEVTPPEKRDNFLAMSILTAAIIIGGALIYSTGLKSGGGLAQVAGGGNQQIPSLDNNNVSAEDDVILGDPNAPVTLIEFGDYQCPYCEAQFKDTEPKIRDEYIKTGKVKMAYRDFPLSAIHPHAESAAEAAECARGEGKYWAYHDALFGGQDKLSTERTFYLALANQLGLDIAKFQACIDGHMTKAEVEKDYQDGIAAQVQGTPATFVVDKKGKVKLISGAQPYEAFKAAIDTALAQK